MQKETDQNNTCTVFKVFCLITGQVFDCTLDEIGTLEDHHVPLKKLFPTSCRKCYGRGYIGRIGGPGMKTEEKQLQPCISCFRKCLDRELVKKIDNK